MGIRKYYWVIVLFFGMESHGQELTSDACHGEILKNLTRNVLKCEVSGTTICVLEVRYYQLNESTGCPIFLSEDTPGRGCCIHDENRCSWISNTNDDRAELQRNCTGLGECNLHSSTGRLVADPCVKTIPLTSSSFSSVRSIKYTCIQNTTSCPDPGRTTTSQNNEEETTVTVETSLNNGTKLTGVTERTGVTELITDGNELSGSTNVTAVTGKVNNSSPNHELFSVPDNGDNGTGVIVGAVLGTVCVIAIIAIILILYFRRNRRKGGPHQRVVDNVDSQVSNTTTTNYYNVESTTPVYYNSGFELSSDSVDHFTGDGNQNVYHPVEGDAMSVTYSKVNKGPAQEVQYAEPDINGESQNQSNSIEYSHIVGDQDSFPVSGDGHYNQVSPDFRPAENVVEDSSGHYFEVKSTYDKLDRTPPFSAQQNEIHDVSNPYNVLDRFSNGK